MAPTLAGELEDEEVLMEATGPVEAARGAMGSGFRGARRTRKDTNEQGDGSSRRRCNCWRKPVK